MIFDHPPHSFGSVVPFYLVILLLVEFVIRKRANYFDIKPFYGVPLGSS